ncbi:MAG: hypothetical protein JOY66_06220 [Acetobacteraceae bacterium]|nr:hypothetical protein [Acetobacteraceae bacterium]
MPAPLTNQPIVSSFADGLTLHLSFDGKATQLGPIAQVRGSAAPAYDQTASVARLDRTLSLEPGNPLDPNARIQVSGTHTQAVSAGMGIDSVSAEGATDIGSADFVLTDNPLSPRGILGLLGLSVSMSHVHTTADYSHVYGVDKSFVTGDASFGSLSLGGALIGKTLTFSGDAAPNTVLFSSPTVTITLDRQTVSDLISGGLTKTLTPEGITTQAIDISLHGAALFGKSLSGDIVIGEAAAGAGGGPALASLHG